MSSTESAASAVRRSPGPEDFRAMQSSEQFRELRRRHRAFTFPMSVAFFLWFLLFVLLATYAPALMGNRVYGYVTWGVVLGLLQFLTTFVITALYIRYANRELEPRAARIRTEMEG